MDPTYKEWILNYIHIVLLYSCESLHALFLLIKQLYCQHNIEIILSQHDLSPWPVKTVIKKALFALYVFNQNTLCKTQIIEGEQTAY